MFLLDTNVVSELRKAKSAKANPNVLLWAGSVLPGELYISAITLLEIEMGILRVERRDEPQAKALRTWFETQVQPAFEGRILAVDGAVALRCAKLHVLSKGEVGPGPDRDMLIAATALEHDLTLVTRNEKDFDGTGAEVFNPW